MEDSFRVRVDKAFGCLSSSTSHLSSLWSLTDDEIEPQQWKPEEFDPRENQKSCNFLECGFLENSSTVEYREDECASGSKDLEKSDEFGNEELEIKSSIGLDPTLDNEEEEDEYDQVAVGKEMNGDCLYLKDIVDNNTDADYYNPLSSSIRDITRDPRANIIAAKVRLKEDAEAAKKLDAEAARKIETLNLSDNDELSAEDGRIKSILRKEDLPDSNSRKRVRFDTECITTSGEEGGAKENLIKESSTDGMEKEVNGLLTETCSMEVAKGKSTRDCLAEGAKDVQVETPTVGAKEVTINTYSAEVAKYIQTGANGRSSAQDHPSQVPSYLRNPSNYTHYTLDSSTDMDEESNHQAFVDFLNLIKKSKTTYLQPENEILYSSKPVIFIPKRKTGCATEEQNEMCSKRTVDAGKELAHKKGISVGMAAVDVVCAMEEDGLETDGDRKISVRRSERQYRIKGRMDSDESQS